VLANPGSAAADTLHFVRSVHRTVARPGEPSPLLRARTGRDWRYGVFDCPLTDLKAAGKVAGGSVNDAYIAVLLGGLRRYHEHFDVQIDELPMAMPVSVRKVNDPMGGNEFAGGLFTGPIGIVDPKERIAAIRDTVRRLRSEPALESISWASPVLNRLPSGAGAAIMARVGSAADMSASTVPGLTYTTYVAGAKVERIYPLAPFRGSR
jgi:diacylglycerol O-acyltransferase / wax synthase